MNKDNIKIWKEKGIAKCLITFNCGGDSMGYISAELFKDNDDEINDEWGIGECLIDQSYDRVSYYECSDGYYMGESGFVEVTLNDAEDDFDFIKSAEAEYSEVIQYDIHFPLTNEELDFVKNYVMNINGGSGGDVINYNKEFIMTDEEEEISNSLTDKISNFVECYDYQSHDNYPPCDWEEIEDDCNWTTDTFDDNGDIIDLIIKDSKLLIMAELRYVKYEESFD